ncbi:hypothetical protein BGW80DRAFT_588036 [Lactifluus volemus]|nr:hypothetical protein BGW80DRAFT_588036 [Lactifluus volemus]
MEDVSASSMLAASLALSFVQNGQVPLDFHTPITYVQRRRVQANTSTLPNSPSTAHQHSHRHHPGFETHRDDLTELSQLTHVCQAFSGEVVTGGRYDSAVFSSTVQYGTVEAHVQPIP